MPRGYIQPIHRMDDNGNILDTYNSAAHAAQLSELIGIRGLHQTNIIQCCRGTRPTAGGYRWAYAKEDKECQD